MTRLRPPGKEDNDVGANGARPFAVFAFNREGLLEDVLLALAQAGFVEQVAEDEFAPVALGFRGTAQGGGEVASFFGQCLIERAEGADERFELGNAGCGLRLRLFDFFSELLDLIAQRR